MRPILACARGSAQAISPRQAASCLGWRLAARQDLRAAAGKREHGADAAGLEAHDPARAGADPEGLLAVTADEAADAYGAGRAGAAHPDPPRRPLAERDPQPLGGDHREPGAV